MEPWPGLVEAESGKTRPAKNNFFSKLSGMLGTTPLNENNVILGHPNQQGPF